MMTFSTFISTRMSSSPATSSDPNSNSPSLQLKKLNAASWIWSRTAASSVARSMTPFCSRMVPMRAPSPSFFCSASAALSWLPLTDPAFTRRSPSGSVWGTATA